MERRLKKIFEVLKVALQERGDKCAQGNRKIK